MYSLGHELKLLAELGRGGVVGVFVFEHVQSDGGTTPRRSDDTQKELGER